MMVDPRYIGSKFRIVMNASQHMTDAEVGRDFIERNM